MLTQRLSGDSAVACLTIAVTLAAASLTALTQQRSIPESLAAEQRPLMQFTGVPSGSSPSLDVVLAGTDLLVVGQLESPRSYLSPDQMDVYTDFEVLDVIQIAHRSKSGSLAQSAKPLIVTFLGGTISINGLSYTSTHEALPIPAVGTRCLLLLKSTPGGYRIAGRYLGAFGIENGLLAPLTRANFARELHGRNVDEVSRQMAANLH